MNFEKITQTFKNYYNLNNTFESIYNELIELYTTEEIEEILENKKLLDCDNEDIKLAMNFLFGIKFSNNEYFSINYFSHGDVIKNYQNNFVEIKSNYINIELLIDDLKQLINVFEMKGNKTQVVILNNFLDENSFFMTDLKIDFNSNFILNNYNDSSVKIYGSEINLELFYDFIQQYFNEIIVYNEKIQIYRQILNGLHFFSNELKTKTIDYLLDDEDNIQIIPRIKIINDINDIDIFKINYSALVKIYEKVRSIDLNTPAYYYDLFMKSLTPKEEAVINLRYRENKTLEQLGQQFDLTRERVRQIEMRALERLTKSKIFNRFCRSILLHCGYTNFFIEDDLKKYEISISFIKKVYDKLLDYGLNDEIYFYKSKNRSLLIDYINSLPEMIETCELNNMLEDYFKDQYTKIETNFLVSWINQKYYKYNKYSFRNKLKNSTVVVLIMKKYFPDGIYLNDDESIENLKRYAKEEYNYDLSESLRAVRAIIQNTCMPSGRGERIYNEILIEIPKQLIDKIVIFVSNYKSDAIPITGIYDNFEDEFNEIGIMNRYSLQGVLKRTFSDKYIITRDYILETSTSSIYNEIELYITNSEHIVTFDELKEYFPGITAGVVQSVIERTGILNMNGYYVNINSLKITDDEKKYLFDLLKENLNDELQHHTKFLFDTIKRKISGLFNRIGLNHYLQFYALIEKMYKDKFNFQRPFIANKNVNIITYEELLINKVLEKEEVTLEELKEMANEVGYYLDSYIIYISKYIDKIIFKSKTVIISIAKVNYGILNVEKFEKILDKFIGNDDYKPLYLFTSYWELPDIGIVWNEWVLYSTILKSSNKYDVITTSKIMKDAIPVIIKKNKKLNDDDIASIESHKIVTDDYDEMLNLDELLDDDF